MAFIFDDPLDMRPYQQLLRRWQFNEEQIKFITQQRMEYLKLSRVLAGECCPNCKRPMPLPSFDPTSYERGLWATMNKSGLFFKCKGNRSGIISWTVLHTRRFITEV